MWRLETLTLADFKSYAGLHRIGPIPPSFAAIVGLNGSGKSNLIDALAFLCGATAKQLRCRQFSDLSHTLATNTPETTMQTKNADARNYAPHTFVAAVLKDLAPNCAQCGNKSRELGSSQDDHACVCKRIEVKRELHLNAGNSVRGRTHESSDAGFDFAPNGTSNETPSLALSIPENDGGGEESLSAQQTQHFLLARQQNNCADTKSVDNKSTDKQTTKAPRGGGDTRYYWNGHSVDRRTYLKSLSRLGLTGEEEDAGPEAILSFGVVAQGCVERISLISARERGALFDALSGSARFAGEYADLAREASEKTSSLRMALANRDVAESDLRGARKQVAELEHFRSLEKQRSELEQDLVILELEEAREAVFAADDPKIRARVSELEAQGLICEREAAEAFAEKQRTLRELTACSRLVHQSAEETRKWTWQMAALEGEKNRAEATHEAEVIAMTEFTTRASEVGTELRNLQAAAAGKQDKTASLIAEVESSLAKNSFTKAPEASRRALTELDGTATLEVEIDAARSHAEFHQERLETARKHQKTLQAESERLTREATALSAKTATQAGRITELEAGWRGVRKNQDQARALASEIECLKSLINSSKPRSGGLGGGVAPGRRPGGGGRVASPQSVIGFLQGQNANVFDRVLDLVCVSDPRFTEAISCALGRQAQSIVVASYEDAMACVALLKQRRLPAEEFLPLDAPSLVGAPPQKTLDLHKRLRQHTDLFTLCLDYVSPHVPHTRCVAPEVLSKLQRLFHTLLGDTVVVDGDFTFARTVAYRELPNRKLPYLKIVTVSGQRFSKNANITLTVGEQNKPAVAEIRQHQQRLDSMVKQHAIMVKQITAFDYDRLVALRAEWVENQEALAGLQSTLASAVEDLEKLEAKDGLLSQLEFAAAEGLNRVKTLTKNRDESLSKSQSMKTTQQALLAARSEHTELLAEKHRLAKNLATELEAFTRSAIHLASRVDLDLEFTSLTPACVAALTTHIADRLEDHRVRCSALEARIGGIVKKQTHLASLKPANAHTAREEKLKIEATAKEEHLTACQKRLAAVLGEKNAATRKVFQNSLRLQAAGGKFVELLEAAAKHPLAGESISLAVDENEPKGAGGAGGSEGGTGGGRAERQPSTSTVAASSVSAYACAEVGAVMCGFREERVPAEEVLAAVASVRFGDRSGRCCWRSGKVLREEISKLSEQLERTAVNFKAVELLAEQQAITGRMRDDFDLARNSKLAVDHAFGALREKRKKMFVECVASVNARLGEIYAELACSASSTETRLLAELELEDEICSDPFLRPVLFHVVPPGKRYATIDALSGGEKAIAALAFLFAAQTFKQTPFMLLDEIDAALDLNHIASLANYLANAPIQTLVVTLKPELYSFATALIGVYNNAKARSSKLLTMDLAPFPLTSSLPLSA